ncbi:MAG: hypothetical protein ACRDPQ_14025 [Nocardioidaceae bacterium]
MKRRERPATVDGVTVPDELRAGWEHGAWVDDRADLAPWQSRDLAPWQRESVCRSGAIDRYVEAVHAFAVEQGWTVQRGSHARPDWTRLEAAGIRKPRNADRPDPRWMLSVG